MYFLQVTKLGDRGKPEKGKEERRNEVQYQNWSVRQKREKVNRSEERRLVSDKKRT